MSSELEMNVEDEAATVFTPSAGVIQTYMRVSVILSLYIDWHFQSPKAKYPY